MRACPICRSALEGDHEAEHSPFCSRRCKLIDLGNWLGDGYRIEDGAPPAPPILSDRQAGDAS